VARNAWQRPPHEALLVKSAAQLSLIEPSKNFSTLRRKLTCSTIARKPQCCGSLQTINSCAKTYHSDYAQCKQKKDVAHDEVIFARLICTLASITTQRACSQGNTARAATAATLGQPLSSRATKTLLSLPCVGLCSRTGNMSAYSSPARVSARAVAHRRRGDACSEEQNCTKQGAVIQPIVIRPAAVVKPWYMARHSSCTCIQKIKQSTE
jgi:hypothetical protein